MTEKNAFIKYIIHLPDSILSSPDFYQSLRACKRSLCLFPVLFLSIIITLAPGCRTGYNPDYINPDEFITDGWMDDNTYRISATGEPKNGISSIIQKKISAKDAAVKAAQISLIEKLKGEEHNIPVRVDEYYSGINPEADELQTVIKKGRIIKETYNEQMVCEIVYEIHSPGLKKIISRINCE